jgi:hypothetical protein
MHLHTPMQARITCFDRLLGPRTIRAEHCWARVVAAGERREELTAKVPKEYAPDGLQPGMVVRLQNGMQVRRQHRRWWLVRSGGLGSGLGLGGVGMQR